MEQNPATVTLARRLIALVYDAIAAFTLVYFAGFIPVVAAGGEALAPGNVLFALYLIAVWFGYFGLCWTRGRTLGMQAWKLELVSTRVGARRVTWGQALVRFAGAALALAPAGAGYLAACFDAHGRTWHDRLSHTRLVRRPLNASADAA